MCGRTHLLSCPMSLWGIWRRPSSLAHSLTHHSPASLNTHGKRIYGFKQLCEGPGGSEHTVNNHKIMVSETFTKCSPSLPFWLWRVVERIESRSLLFAETLQIILESVVIPTYSISKVRISEIEMAKIDLLSSKCHSDNLQAGLLNLSTRLTSENTIRLFNRH